MCQALATPRFDSSAGGRAVMINRARHGTPDRAEQRQASALSVESKVGDPSFEHDEFLHEVAFLQNLIRLRDLHVG